MITKTFSVQNKLGIHARPAAQFVRTAGKFASEVTVEREGERVDGKSIMGLMMLAVGYGMEITVTVDGSDEADAMQAIESLVDRKFDED